MRVKFSLTGDQLRPVTATQSSTYDGNAEFVAARCIDGDVGQDHVGHWAICATNSEHYPWIAIDYGKRVTVQNVEIFNRRGCCGNRAKNVHVRVSDKIPSSSAGPFLSGKQLGEPFVGPADDGATLSFSDKSGKTRCHGI